MSKAIMPKYIGPGDLAEILGVSPRRVTQLVAEGHIHKDGVGKYDIRQCVQDYIRFSSGTKEDEDIAEARRRKAVADAGLAEIELKETAGELVSAEEMQAAVEADYGRLRSHLLALPSKLAPLVVGKKSNAVIVEIAGSLINEALADLSGETNKSSKKSAGNSAATTKTDGEPVGGPEAAS